MQLSDYIGQNITLLIPSIHETTLQSVRLLGVETGGIWIHSQWHTNEVLQVLGKPSAPKTIAMFLPYHAFSYGLGSMDELALSEKAFGV